MASNGLLWNKSIILYFPLFIVIIVILLIMIFMGANWQVETGKPWLVSELIIPWRAKHSYTTCYVVIKKRIATLLLPRWFQQCFVFFENKNQMYFSFKFNEDCFFKYRILVNFGSMIIFANCRLCQGKPFFHRSNGSLIQRKRRGIKMSMIQIVGKGREIVDATFFSKPWLQLLLHDCHYHLISFWRKDSWNSDSIRIESFFNYSLWQNLHNILLASLC